MIDWDEEFASLQKEGGFYPGSSKKLPVLPPAPITPSNAWDAKPRLYLVGGVSREFFTVGHLAEALNRKPVTIRKWEREGVIPMPTFRAPSDDPRGRRRLYTREQIEGIVAIATDEGILQPHAKAITKTAFTTRVTQLFKDLG